MLASFYFGLRSSNIGDRKDEIWAILQNNAIEKAVVSAF